MLCAFVIADCSSIVANKSMLMHCRHFVLCGDYTSIHENYSQYNCLSCFSACVAIKFCSPWAIDRFSFGCERLRGAFSLSKVLIQLQLVFGYLHKIICL
jgi:hypothetical protein